MEGGIVFRGSNPYRDTTDWRIWIGRNFVRHWLVGTVTVTRVASGHVYAKERNGSGTLDLWIENGVLHMDASRYYLERFDLNRC